MKIYFAGSIRGGREDVKLYSEIIKYICKYGKVLTEHVADESLIEDGEQDLSDREIHDRDMDWLYQSDVIVAEVTTASLGVGYEIRAAVNKGKKVLCLYRLHKNKRLSAMIGGSPNIVIKTYSHLNDAYEIIDEFFKDFNCPPNNTPL